MLEKKAYFKLSDLRPLNKPLFKDNLFRDFGIEADIEAISQYKTASAKSAELESNGDNTKFDLEAEIKGHPDSLFVKCFAIKADEMNDNGDYFSQDELIKATPTFVGVPVFTNHQNSDINQARGKVVHSWWDAERNGITVIARVDAEAYPQLARGIKEEYIVGTSMGCFPGNMRVLVESGEYIPIKDIQTGDMVYTHLGNIKPVLNVQRHLDKENDFIYQIKVEGIPETLECTKEHPFWILKEQNICSCGCGSVLSPVDKFQSPLRRFKTRQKKGHYQKCRMNERNNFNFEWKSAKELKVGDFVSFPISSIEKNSTDATVDKCRLIGYFLAEGSFNKNNGIRNTAVFSLSYNENDTLVKEIKKLLSACFPENKIYIQNKKSKGSTVVYCYGKNVADWFFHHCGEYSHNKKLATECLTWPKEVQKHIVGAWLAGDGYQRELNNSPYSNFVGSTVSEVLRNQIVLLLSRFGIKSTTNVVVDNKVSTLIKAAGLESVNVENGTGAATRRPSYVISISPTLSTEIARFVSPYKNKEFSFKAKREGSFRRTNSHIVFPIKSITKRFNSEPVYNLQVKTDHSYIVEGVAVKNCQVKYSLCSICHNKAETPDQYCEHIRERKTRQINARSQKCSYHKHGDQNECPICGSTKDQIKAFAIDSKAFEYNYGIKFIENSFVVNPACHECGVTEIIDPQVFLQKISAISNILPKLLKAASNASTFCDDTKCVKLAGQKEIGELNQALDLLTSVSQSMLQQKAQIDLEFLSDLVSVLADLQTVTDELTEQGYGRLQSPGGEQTEPTAGKTEETTSPKQQATHAVNPTPGGGSKIQSGPAGNVGTVTSPTGAMASNKQLNLEKTAKGMFKNNTLISPAIFGLICQAANRLLNIQFKISTTDNKLSIPFKATRNIK